MNLRHPRHLRLNNHTDKLSFYIITFEEWEGVIRS